MVDYSNVCSMMVAHKIIIYNSIWICGTACIYQLTNNNSAWIKKLAKCALGFFSLIKNGYFVYFN